MQKYNSYVKANNIDYRAYNCGVNQVRCDVFNPLPQYSGLKTGILLSGAHETTVFNSVLLVSTDLNKNTIIIVV